MSLLPSGFGASGAGTFYNDNVSSYSAMVDNHTGASKFRRVLGANADSSGTATISMWVRRSAVETQQFLFLATNTAGADANTFSVQFNNEDRVFVANCSYYVESAAKFKDTTNYYHILAVADNTNATASERTRVYVNGVRIDAFDTYENYPPQNTTGFGLSGHIHLMGDDWSTRRLDGYYNDVHYLDGIAADPEDFGEWKNGVWIRKNYTGSYGSQGIHLDFADSANMGNDVSDNNLDMTVTGTVVQTQDRPENRFVTGVPANYNVTSTPSTLRFGGLYHIGSGSTNSTSYFNYETVDEYMDQNIYFEVKITAQDSLGAGYFQYVTVIGENGTGVSMRWREYNLFSTGITVISGGLFNVANGDIVSVVVDMNHPDGRVYYFKNGVLSLTAQPNVTTGRIRKAYIYQQDSSTSIWHYCYMNFGQNGSFGGTSTAQGYTDINGHGDFYYDIASTYNCVSLCTANLPDPAIGGAASTQSDDYFKTVLWTGDGATPTRSITGYGFQPDFLWTKSRNNAVGSDAHWLYDVVRGAGTNSMLTIASNSTAAEFDATGGNGNVTSIDTDGFTITAGTSGTLNRNESGIPYVGWGWKAGGTAVTNTDGSITSTVSANPEAGFSIVKYTGTGAAATVGHSLNSAPEMVIIKNRTDGGAGDQWYTWHSGLTGDNYFVELDTSNAEGAQTSLWDGPFTSTVFDVKTHNGVNGSGDSMIAYCFHSVDGHCKVGSYSGTGSAEYPPAIDCGFEPAFVMVKRTDATGNWVIQDNVRKGYNLRDKALYPNVEDPEGTGLDCDFHSYGFRPATTGTWINASGGKYVYLAFAKNPFKYSNGGGV